MIQKREPYYDSSLVSNRKLLTVSNKKCLSQANHFYIRLSGHFTVSFDIGDRFIVSEYFIEAKKHVNIYEGMFIPYLKNSLAISIIKTNLEPTEFTRMLVVSLNSEAKE